MLLSQRRLYDLNGGLIFMSEDVNELKEQIASLEKELEEAQTQDNNFDEIKLSTAVKPRWNCQSVSLCV